jgi:hypothetical protein
MRLSRAAALIVAFATLAAEVTRAVPFLDREMVAPFPPTLHGARAFDRFVHNAGALLGAQRRPFALHSHRSSSLRPM